MRFSEPNRAKAGLFSPIVFASGITYLQSRGRAADQTVYIAYVENTTATDVLDHACTIDLFGVVQQADRGNLAVMCETASVVRNLEKMRQLAKPPAEGADSRGRGESFHRLKWSVVRDAPEAVRHEVAAAEERANAAPDEKKADARAIVDQWEAVATTLQGDELDPQKVMLADCIDAKGCQSKVEALERDFGRSCQELELPDRTAGSAADQQATDDSPRDAAKKDPRDRLVVYRFCPMPDHEAAIRWLCERRFGNDSSKTLVYLGDRDIILGKLRTWNSRERARCAVESERGGDDLTYEPYALMVSNKAPKAWEIAQLVQRRVYEFFSFKGLAVAAFDAYFPPDVKMSPLLGYLFLLNGVEEERHFLNPTEPLKVPDAKEVAPVKEDLLVSSVTRAHSAAPPSPHPVSRRRFTRARSPATRVTAERGRPRDLARKATSASLAAPSTGGAATRTSRTGLAVPDGDALDPRRTAAQG